MGYDLSARNKELDSFHFGAFSFPVLLEACGYLFSSIHKGGRWYCAFGADNRMGDRYPGILANDGFRVTAEEAKIMARIARNFVTIQRTLPDEDMTDGINGKDATINRERLVDLLAAAMHGGAREEWPQKIRTDFVDLFEAFADWADKSRGFAIH